MAELKISVSGGEVFSRAMSALAEADDSLAVHVPEEARLLADRLAAIAKKAVLGEPTHGLKQRDLRATVSEGVDVRQNGPGDVTITTSMPKPDEAELPRGMDEPVRGWQHPVFGNRNNWVRQHDAFSWFTDSMQSGQEEGQRDLERLLKDAVDRVIAETA